MRRSNLPAAISRTAVLAVLVGFPVALVLAWFFEVRVEADRASGAGSEMLRDDGGELPTTEKTREI